ncbi:MAG: branched-chain amino acid transport system substrate-binding protein [Gaiellales bacterium]|nr:branched-chain amino acid transport system substrate-binding protein [Gaiellales bacterium]
MRISKSMSRVSAIASAAAVSAITAVTLGAVPAVAASSSSASAAAGVSCSKTLKIAMVTPLTGGAAFLGQEQLSWAKYAVKTLAPAMGLKIQLLQGDTPVEQGPAPAQTLAQKYAADPSVVGIVGPSTSGAVVASSKTYGQAGIAEISPSATKISLTKGSPRDAAPSFFRDVPADDVQGPSDANYMIKTLKAKNVVLIDFQEPYSVGLVGQVGPALKAAGVTVTSQSIPNTVTDFSSYVTNVPASADYVFFPSQKPADAQAFASQLAEQGKKAKVFGGDGTNGPGVFKAAGSYLSNFAPDITGIAADKAIIDGWKKDNKGKTVGSFGPPTYGATQILKKAIKAACTVGKCTMKNRGAVVTDMRKVTIPNFILGGTFKWSKINTQDPANAKFYIFQIQSDGTYKLVG